MLEYYRDRFWRQKDTGIACTDEIRLLLSGLKNLPTPEVISFFKNIL